MSLISCNPGDCIGAPEGLSNPCRKLVNAREKLHLAMVDSIGQGFVLGIAVLAVIVLLVLLSPWSEMISGLWLTISVIVSCMVFNWLRRRRIRAKMLHQFQQEFSADPQIYRPAFELLRQKGFYFGPLRLNFD